MKSAKLIREMEKLEIPKTLEEMRKIQKELSRKVITRGKFEADYVIGVDQAFSGDTVISACVALDLELNVVCNVIHAERTEVPYIPTYLMFREGPSAVNAVKKILKKLDSDKVCIMVDGSGIAHPRKCGLATYVGLSLSVQSIGITKSKLYGFYKKELKEVLDCTEIFDEKGEKIGYVLKTCKKCKPIYISPGHMISPDEALKAVLVCLKGYKLPEPVRLAHELATLTKKKGCLTLDSF